MNYNEGHNHEHLQNNLNIKVMNEYLCNKNVSCGPLCVEITTCPLKNKLRFINGYHHTNAALGGYITLIVHVE